MCVSTANTPHRIDSAVLVLVAFLVLSDIWFLLDVCSGPGSSSVGPRKADV